MSAAQAPCSPMPRFALPLPTPDWGAADGLAAYQAARPLLELPLGEDPQLVAALTTVVLRSADFAVKVYPPGTDVAHLQALNAALAASATALVPVAAPVETPHGAVSVSRWLPQQAPVGWPQLGGLLRAFHDEHRFAPVPAWTPLSRLPSQMVGLDPEAARVLLAARERLLGELARVRSELGDGVIHGDVSLLNVMRDRGMPRLIDIDWVARGPREYDLASSARRVRNGEISAEEYRGFCDAYGFDVTSWDGLWVLDRIADLSGVAFRLWDDRRCGRDLGWVPAEVAHWRRVLDI